MARPPSPHPKDTWIHFRVSKRQLAVIDSRRKGLTRSAYLRLALNKMAAEETKTSVTEDSRP